MYNKAIELLTSKGRFHIELGLNRISQAMDLLDNPQDNLKIIHVAGTNGKGSVCAMLSSILSEAGYKTGLYTSPHLFDYTERIKINGAEIPRSDFANLIFEVCKLTDENEIYLTEFEILTAVMFKYFSDNNVDVVILETGLGGRFDATNVIRQNRCSVITHIDFDHTERLGDTLEKIAFEKAGIIKPNCPVITKEEYLAIKEIADRNNSPIIEPENHNFELPLKGSCQKENANLAVTAIKNFFPTIDDEIIQNGLSKVNHPARFQVIGDNLIVDGCHNLNGVIALKDSLDLHFPHRSRRFVFGCLNNKNYKSMLEALLTPEDEIYFCAFNSENSCTYEQLQNTLSTPSAHKFESFDRLPQDDRLNIVCGSIYMIGEIIPQHILLG